MRQPRIRPSDTDAIMHICNRISGAIGECPFGPAEKQYFINLMRDLTNLFMIEIIGYQLMGNHFILNYVRARLVQKPQDYRFGSFGVWSAKGRHPFEETILTRVLPFLPPILGIKDLRDLWKALYRNLTVEAAVAWKQPVVMAEVRKSAEKERFSTRIDRRVRYWADGLVIGSEIYVKTVVARARGEAVVAKRRLVRALGADPDTEAATPPLLFCYKQLRRMV